MARTPRRTAPAGDETDPFVKKVTMTPALAEEILQNNDVNRHIRQHQVESYARQMKDGEWTVSWDLPAIDPAGNVRNGQHRLLAIVQSGITLDLFVMYDCPAKAQDTGDRGSARTVGDALRLSGESYWNLLASAIFLVWHYENDDMRRQNACTTAEARRMLKDHPGLRDSVARAASIRRDIPALQPSAIAGLHYLTKQEHPDIAEEFWDKLAEPTDLPSGSPMLVLRKMLTDVVSLSTNRVTQKTKPNRTVLVASTILAWNQYVAGNGVPSVRSLQWRWEDKFPVIE